MIDSYDVLRSSYDRHKLIYKVMILNKKGKTAITGQNGDKSKRRQTKTATGPK